MESSTKVLIITENANIGGLTSSLLNLISAARSHNGLDITVGLINFSERHKFPNNVNVIDLSCFSRLITKKIHKYSRLLKIGLISTIKLHRLKKAMKNDRSLAAKHIELVQRREIREAKILKCTLDFTADYDAVVSWNEMYTNYVLAYKIKAKRKIAWIHPHYEQAEFSRKIDEKILKRVDALVAVSKEGRDALVRAFPNFPDKCRYVYNKVMLSDIIEKSHKEEIGFDNDVVNLITVARIQNVSKAFDRTLPIIKKLKCEGFRFKWRIFGGGEDAELIKRLILEYGLEECVELYGFTDNPFPYVKASDAFLLFSRYEGFPMVIDEAKILGTPSIVTNYAAANEQIINGETGIIVSNSQEGIYDGLKETLKNPNKLLEIRKNLENQNFDFYTDCDDFISLIKDI